MSAKRKATSPEPSSSKRPQSWSQDALSSVPLPLLESRLPAQKNSILKTLAGEIPSLPTDTEEWQTLRTLLSASLMAKEGNSCLLIGAAGSGKSMLLDSVLASLEADYYRVALDANVQTTDRGAMREMATQLIMQGAFAEGDFTLEQVPEEQQPDQEGDQIVGGDQVQDQDSAMAGAILSSLSNTISHIISLLSAESSASHKPLVITLDAFDLFTSRPRQALLYCLLDAVQAGSYGAGLAVVGMTARVDTTDLLEKRVKSRFSHRIVHVRPPDSYEAFKSIARSALLPQSPDDDFSKAWQTDIDSLFSHAGFKDILRDIYEISNDIRTLYRVLFAPISSLSPSNPTPAPLSFISSATSHLSDGLLSTLRDLTDTEFSLLIAAKHLQTQDRHIFNFEMCFDQLVRFNRSTDRRVAFMCFNTLLDLEIFLPESSISSLSLSRPTGGVRKEYIKVRCVLDPPVVIRAAKDKERREPLSSALVKWAQAHG